MPAPHRPIFYRPDALPDAHFSGPGRAVGPLCGSVCVQTITFEVITCDLNVWHNGSPLRVLTGLLTGHATLNRHLAVMKIRTDRICSACGEEDETSVHFWGKCPATIMARHSIVGSHFLRLDELRCIQPHALMRFARVS